MILYHGTYERNYKEIIEEGFIDNFYDSNDTTDIINDCIEYYGDEACLREGAVFLFDDIEHASVYDYVFKIDVKYLNINYLYVADFHISTEIYDAYMRGKDKVKELVKSYENNFMSFEDYLKNKSKIIIPEFLYFKKIPLKIAESINIIDEAFLESM